MASNYQINWTLETIYPGGVETNRFQELLLEMASRVHALKESLDSLEAFTSHPEQWAQFIHDFETLSHELITPTVFASCWSSVRTLETAPRLAYGKMLNLFSLMEEIQVPIQNQLDVLSNEEFERFVTTDMLADYRELLKNRRSRRHLRNDSDTETLLAQVMPQALTGWGQLYTMIAGRLQAEIKLPGEAPKTMGISQVSALMHAPDEGTRKAAHTARNEAWATEETVCSLALYQITETRRKRNARCGVGELEHTLTRNRLDGAALDAMWAACDAARPALLEYLRRKAQLMGKESLEPWNMSAPRSVEENPSLSWEEACDWIKESFDSFDPEMADFADRALSKGWVDALPGANRRAGGYCTGVSTLNESRIFMTFNETYRSATTLAHELGHAWHNEVLFKVPHGKRNIVSSTAETASTFAEALFRDHLFDKAQSEALKLQLLDQQLIAGASFLMGLPVRFSFERKLYELAAKGPFSPSELSETYAALFKDTYADTVSPGPTHLWCSTLHYYIAQFGFYNWPYTFGYLFSGHIYQQAKLEGKAFREPMTNLLLGTGTLPSVELAQRHLNVDITTESFWVNAITPLLDTQRVFMEKSKAFLT